jgi:hypothetical protein
VVRVPLPVVTIGWRAQAALAGPGAIRPLGAPSAYFAVGGELIWLGRVGASLHARAVLVPRVPEQLDALVLDRTRAHVWRPSQLAASIERSVLHAACRRLGKELSGAGDARGFGALLVGQSVDASLERAVRPARALARACGKDDPTAAVAAAEELIGLGPGLTPAGDDFVGGAFFARAILAPAATAVTGWTQASARLRAVAATRTHPVSAVLLSDLLAGEGHEPLHDLAKALADGTLPMALAAARRLVSIGHSSGWDLLTGFLAGVLGLLHGDPRSGWERGTRAVG